MGNIISATGEGLNIIIAAKTKEDWQAYTTWFSIVNNLPQAKVVLAIFRDGNFELKYYQWAKRIKLPHYYLKSRNNNVIDCMQCIFSGIQKGFCNENILLLRPGVVVLDIFNENELDIFNNSNDLIQNELALFTNSKVTNKLSELMDDYILLGKTNKIINTPLYLEAKESELEQSLISFDKGCGRWLNNMKGCPLASAGALVSGEMTANERRVIELWREAASFYSAVS